MTGRRPARLLAPLALVLTAVALFAVVNSGGGSSSKDAAPPAGASPTASATKGAKAKSAKPKTYTVKAGDTPSSIAQKAGVSVGDLMDANPTADAKTLHPGQKLKLP